jgi:two-component system, cell cycle sensor histidine kinase and response regulator CckA
MQGTDDPLSAELALLRAENTRLLEELRTSQERFQLGFVESPVGMLVVCLATARFVDTNQAYCDFLGYSRQEILDADPYEFWVKTTTKEDHAREQAEVFRLASGESTGYRIVKGYIRKDGSVRYGDLTTCASQVDGKIRLMVGQIVDVHEQVVERAGRAALEDRLRQAEKLESMGRLVGGVAHDFNNRLLVILGHAELLKRNVEGRRELELHADAVLVSARRAADLTRQLLAFSRRQVLRPEACDLDAIVERMRRMLERVIGETIELVTVLGAGRLTHADPGQLEHVILNLVLNSRDAMPEGGRITIRTAGLRFDENDAPPDLAPGGYVKLSVTDTGSGIPAALHGRIFEPFFTTKEVGRGTGLGLSMTEGIVRQSGGSIALESEEGRGTTFTLYLPEAVVGAAPEAEPARELTAGPRNVGTILVVDDESDVRRLLLDVLRIASFEVLEAHDGVDALEIARGYSGTIELLLTDVVMPGLSGPELAAELRASRPELEVLFMSGYAERSPLSELGPRDHYIQKPFLPRELFVQVREILDRVPQSIQQTG